MSVFIISSPEDFLKNEPLQIEGKDRIDALSKAGFTVWTKEEWDEASTRCGFDYKVKVR